MSRATLKLKRPITQIDIDIDENDLEANGFVKVVRCKDCEFYNGDYCHCANDIFAKPDGYCSYGGRREDASKKETD